MSAIGGMVGGLVDTFAGGGDEERKKQDAALAAARGEYNYNTHAKDQAGTEFDKIDPTSRDAMMRAMGDYESKVNAGGLDAIARANLEQGKAEAAQTAAQSAAAVARDAQRRGTGGGARAQLQQAIVGQQAGEGARRSAFDSAALAESARNEALKGMTGTAGAVYGMDANRAAAQDAINQFNVRNAQANIANDATRAKGAAGVELQQAGVEGERADKAAHKFSNIGSAIGGGVAGAIPGVGMAVEGATQGIKQIGEAFRGGSAPSAASWGDTYTGSYGMDDRGT